MFLRNKQFFNIEDIQHFKTRLLSWGQQHETIIWLDSNNYKQKYSSFESCLAIGEYTSIKTDCFNAFEKLKKYQSYTKDYIFGYLSYDLKNDVENLNSTKFDGLCFPELFFFQPKKIIFIKKNKVEFQYLKIIKNEIKSDLNEILNFTYKTKIEEKDKKIKINLRITKKNYYKKLIKIIEYINKGYIYETNFCQEFYAENTLINPYEIYKNLNTISKSPFATFLKVDDKYLLSASPERFIKKIGNKIISQPIKGTAKRCINKYEDKKISFNLSNDKKELSENIMIVDLVRNDLSKTAIKGSVKVEQLCKVFSFKQVHQLISTVVSQIKQGTHSVDVIKSIFPMASMTGVPKISAMKIIEEIEQTKRSLYSGTVGYFDPDGNFDFNVIIRSILYNSSNKYVSYSVGGAITKKSIPEKEYEECMLKAKAMNFVLTKKI